jgi:zinc/manganese transport system substrate-binding protein
MLRRTLLAAAALAAAVSLPAAASAQDRPVRVVASFSILADMAKAVGGDAVEVVSIIGPDADSHVYQPTPSDARKLADADLVIVNGHGFEGWMTRLIRSAGYRGPVVTATDGIRTLRGEGGHSHGHSHGHAHGHSHDGPDPHVWQDPRRAQFMARNIGEGLARVAPAKAEAFRANVAAYRAELEALEQWAQAEIARVPEDRRRVVVGHDSFRYMGDRFGIRFLPAQGVTTDSEPTAQQVARLIRQIERERIAAVFVENITNPRLIEQIASEAGARVGGRLYSDALSAPGGDAPTYLDLVRHNVRTIVAALAEAG